MKRFCVMIIALMCVGAFSMATCPISAQTKREVKVKPLNLKK